MATVSFEKSFLLSDQATFEKLTKSLDTSKTTYVKQRDYVAENKKGIEQLKRRLSNSEK
ncbi:hypothetical protein [Acinetobacter sp. HZNU-JH01]|uniref:hypothetical protein n=1 Tax=Acinetobacter sp. HZNU-JH01 TaxID=3136280 RepID=UPI0030F48DF5